MRDIKLKWATFKDIVVDRNLQINYYLEGNYYKILAFDGQLGFITEVEKEVDRNADQIDFEDNFKNLANTNANIESAVNVTEQTPFAKPDYRTKRDATDTWVDCPENTATEIDFYIAEERYVSGGEIIFKNAKEGDYITAEVHDKLAVVPEAYRAAVAENWPTMASYIVKKWIVPTEVDGYGSFMIDTYPLNAQIAPYFYLRVTYHSSSEVGMRKCAVNYHLTKKL